MTHKEDLFRPLTEQILDDEDDALSKLHAHLADMLGNR